MSKNKALIVGGGIAGTAAAIALGRQGVACDLVEMNSEAAGATITLLSRSLTGLADLGILDRVLEEGMPTRPETHWRYLDASGEEIPTPAMPAREETDLPWGLYIMRPDLMEIMREAAANCGTNLRMGVGATSFTADADAVTATFSDGTKGTYDFLIGADGVHSSVRSTFFPDAPTPTYSGLTMFRGMFDGISDAFPTGAYMHGETFVMTHRVRDGRFYIATGRKYAERPHISPEEARQTTVELMAPYTAPAIRAVAEQITDDYKMVVNDYNVLMVPAPWHKGRVLLIGDAAHTTAATLSYGGGLAIEDGVVLGQEMAAGGTIDAIFERFTQRRYERARMVVETANEVQRQSDSGATAEEQNNLRAAAFAELSQPY